MSIANKVLVITPHPDDEVLGVGGTIAKHVKNEDFVLVCFVCNRAYSHRYSEESIREDKENALNAKRILSYHQHIFLDLKDERLDERLINVIVPIEKVIFKFKPDIVYIPHKGDNNQDHRAVFKASMVALRTFSASFVKEVFAYEVLSSTEQSASFVDSIFMPNYYVDIKEFIEVKKLAFESYQREKREFPHPRSIKGIEILAMKRGMEANLEYAEAFEVVRMIKK